MAVREGGREAITHWEVLETFNGRSGKPVASLIACQLETGRTHQIRVHLAHIGHPLLGDAVYGPHFKTKASRAGRRPPGRRWRRWAARRCTPICWCWSTPQTGEILRMDLGSAGRPGRLAARAASDGMTQVVWKKLSMSVS